MATNNAVNNGLSSQTGTGSFVGSTSPTLVTPNIGVATATSLAFSPTTSGMIGTTTANNASSGIVGEYINSINASGVSMGASGTTVIITSISVPAGDWDVTGQTTSYGSLLNEASGWTNTTTGVYTGVLDASTIYPGTVTTMALAGVNTPPLRYSLTTTTTIYLLGQVFYNAGGSATGYGQISARRVR